MGFKCGIVGLPNVGKSTLFNALTKAKIEAANYPFCTIEPNVGIIPVPEKRLQTLSDLVNPEKTIPAVVEFVDIAGLVKGANEGEGLGNQFLSNIRETDAIIQVVRCFDDENVIHVSGTVDAINDVEIINLELMLADVNQLEKAQEKINKLSKKTGDKESQANLSIINKALNILMANQWLSKYFWKEDELKFLQNYGLITLKPMLYVANVDEMFNENNHHLKALQSLAEKYKHQVIPICAQIEAELIDLSNEEKNELLKELNWQEIGLDKVIRAGYELLGLSTYFTAGKKEVRAWTIIKDSLAPVAAGKIHSDFEKGFIRAEVIAYQDYIELGGEQKAKEQGKLRVEGKTYPVQDGDVIKFLFNT